MEESKVPDWTLVAAQLRKPTGEAGIKTGENMNLANTGMTMAGFSRLNVTSGDRFLEIGPGNGEHVARFRDQVPGLKYNGIDISETMVEVAARSFSGVSDVDFKLSDGNSIPFGDESFDRILTVNTLYFWENPLEYAREINRVLRPGGTVCIAFALKSFMEQLPFTAFGFRLYDPQEVDDLFASAGFSKQKLSLATEMIRSNTGEDVRREYALVLASR